MRRFQHVSAVLVLAAFAPWCSAAPPKLDIPAEVKPTQGYIRFTPTTDAVSVTYVSLDGLYPFPSEELKDARRFVLPVVGVQPGRYRFVAVGASNTGEQATREFVAIIGDAPAPDPKPKPDPPGPGPTPKGFRVIFVYETSQPLPLAMQQVMFGERVRTYLDAKTIKGGNQAGWRRWDKDVDAANEKDAEVKALWQAARPHVTTVPCVIVAVDGKAEILPLPASEDAALELFRKYGG